MLTADEEELERLNKIVDTAIPLMQWAKNHLSTCDPHREKMEKWLKEAKEEEDDVMDFPLPPSWHNSDEAMKASYEHI